MIARIGGGQRSSCPDPGTVESWFLCDTPRFQIVPELSPRGDRAVFGKLAISAFAGTPLEMALRDLGIRAFAIAGVALEIVTPPGGRRQAICWRADHLVLHQRSQNIEAL